MDWKGQGPRLCCTKNVMSRCFLDWKGESVGYWASVKMTLLCATRMQECVVVEVYWEEIFQFLISYLVGVRMMGFINHLYKNAVIS